MDHRTATYRRVTWRLVPFLFACYILAYVDRVNVGFAKLQMQADLGMSDTVYGAGAGLFFVGYFLLEVPANMMLRRLGARRWLGPIMIAWGLVSAAMIFVKGAASFYFLRFLLGVVESGFFPGVMLYLTFWYPQHRRARIVAMFISANPLSGVLAGPVSGWILAGTHGLASLRPWQLLFLVEGLPSVLAGAVTLLYLTDGPALASWLNREERGIIAEDLDHEEHAKRREGASARRFRDAFSSGKVWVLCLIFFGIQMGNYGLAFWLPQILKDTLTADPWTIGLVSTIPWGTAAIAMVIYAHHSDQTGERRWHVALGVGIAGMTLAMGGLPGVAGWPGLALLTCTTVAIMCTQAVFWSLPTAVLSGAAAAAGIAWINSVGNLAGYLSPFLVGRIRDATGAMTGAYFTLGGSCLAASALILAVTRPKTRDIRHRSASSKPL
ncbi:MAG TPA: MFS transporter [Bryobacteraceae bacterium]|nr:MFS transporter [Bryobacteraceae bacterium]